MRAHHRTETSNICEVNLTEITSSELINNTGWNKKRFTLSSFRSNTPLTFLTCMGSKVDS